MQAKHLTGACSPPVRCGSTAGLLRQGSVLIALLLCLCSMASLAAGRASQAETSRAHDDGLLWQISLDGQPRGYLLGTIHSEDPRVVDFSPEFLAQLESCSVFAMEMVPDLPTLQRLTEYMHYSDPGQLRLVLGEERFARAMQALESYQVPADWKSRMKVWALMMTLSVPPPKSGFFMDLSLSLRAAGSGLKVIGLETLEQQLSFMEQMPLDFQIRLLDQALVDYERVSEVHDQMVEAYLQGSLGGLQALSDEQFALLSEEIRAYFIDEGITARNQRMAANLLQTLQEDRVYAAVGALHLPGPQGLVTLLRAAGYELTPIALELGVIVPAQPALNSMEAGVGFEAGAAEISAARGVR